MTNGRKIVPVPVLKRMPTYLSFVKTLQKQGERHVSSTRIAKYMGIDATQVTKDLSHTGISGKTSRRIGAKLKKLSQASVAQVLCVTHSAQVASLADHHLLISKSSESGRTVTTVERLDTQARVEELARIIGGMTVTDAARNAARELMDNG